MKPAASPDPASPVPQEQAQADAPSTPRVTGRVRGERGAPSIARALSLQARANHYLALGLILAIGTGLLLWYYTQQLSRQEHARHGASSDSARLAAAQMALPSLGPIEPPPLVPAPPSPSPSPSPAPAPAPAPAPRSVTPVLMLPEPPLLALSAARTPTASLEAAVGSPTSPAPAPGRSALQRRLSGSVFFTAPVNPDAAADQPIAAVAAGTHTAWPLPGAPDPTGAAVGDGAHGGLTALLQAASTPTAAARLLPDRSLLLPKGAFIDCTLETAIDSTLPGMTTCVTATDTFGADGRVVLLERGTKLVGETRGEVQQGAARVFVLWTEARTPDGVIVPLDSPGADQLGRSGLPGKVQRHFWERFGAAILVSSIDAGVQAAVQSSNRGNGTVIYDPGAAQDVMTEVLKSTVAIAPTVIKRNGDRIQVLVARDVDFSDVYELRDVVRHQ